jgi:hypothetical protein
LHALLLERPCWQKLFGLQSLHLHFKRLCWQRYVPQSLHRLFWRPCGQKFFGLQSLHARAALGAPVLAGPGLGLGLGLLLLKLLHERRCLLLILRNEPLFVELSDGPHRRLESRLVLRLSPHLIGVAPSA